MLKLLNIKKNYYVADMTVEALKGINLCFRKNEFVSILGPSGCGKTTLLNIIGGLDQYSDGDLFINGISTKDFTDRDWDVYRNHRIGFIFQSYNLIPHQTVLSNVELALTIAGMSKQERVEKAKKALDRVGLSSQYNKKPNQLSGGQCQRVAIARALVNEPEILLADEPTGALDTETSVQIMDLIKEIAQERLVIMVTHNPDLANKYSTRIVNLLDGLVTSDSNPFDEAEEEAEILAIKEAEQISYDEDLAKLEEEHNNNATPLTKKELKKFERERNAKERAKMSFWTAFKLSFKNLWSKRGRTIMVGFAGSIGIIGVATVLAVSQGVSDYITGMQDDLLSGNPIAIQKSGIDYESLINSSSFLTQMQATTKGYEDGKINVNSQIEYLVSNEKALASLTFNNEFNKDYVDYVKSMPEEYYNAIKLNYGLDLNYNLYTDFTVGHNSELKESLNGVISLNAINQIYTKALANMEGYGKYADLITGLTSPLAQAVPNNEYILSQYDLIEGKMPTSENEILMVLDNNSMMADLILAQMGYYTQEQFYALVYHTLNNVNRTGYDENNNPVYKDGYVPYDESNYKPQFTTEEILNKKFTWYPNDSCFVAKSMIDFDYKYREEDIKNKSGAIELKISGIVRPKENISYGSLKSGFIYQEDLARTMISKNINSSFVRFINSMADKAGMEYLPSTVSYDLEYYWEEADLGIIYPMGIDAEDNTKPATAKITVGSSDQVSQITSVISSSSSSSMDMTTIIQGLLGQVATIINADPNLTDEEKEQQIAGATKTINQFSSMLATMLSDKRLYAYKFGGSFLPQSIRIYPKNFETKDNVTNYLSTWNEIEGSNAKTVTFKTYDNYFNPTGLTRTLTPEERQEIKYTDSVGLIIGLINTMINIVTYALVAFTALSLVVSTVMIAIITYVSVMERIKEIGVIRSLGGRKKDVSHLFNAETFIIGLASGVLGIAVTYILTLIANLIVRIVSGGAVKAIANLTPLTALIMVAVSIILTSISGLIPAKSAAKKDPVIALRTE